MRKRKVLLVTGAALVAAAAVAASTPVGADSGGPDSRDSMKVELGRRLFFDPSVGRRGQVGCADCHQPEKGFSDPRVQSVDEDRILPRHSQPTVDLGGEGFHWDGEFDTVRDLIDSRILPAADALDRAERRRNTRMSAATTSGVSSSEVSSRMHGTVNGYGGGGSEPLPEAVTFDEKATPVAARLAQDHRYDEGFRLAYGDPAISSGRVGEAIEAYVASLRTTENALDRHFAGKNDALNDAQLRGLSLFGGRANCSQCHSLEVKNGRAAMTDGKFHDTGVGFGATTEAMVTIAGQKTRLRSRAVTDRGRGGATFLPRDDSSFKTPSLRDVARTAPYMHDASLATLEDVVAYYDKGGTPNPHLDPRIKRLSLTVAERDDLVAFLRALTGEERAGLGAVPDYRRRAMSLTILDLEGRSVANLPIRVVPCGDRLRGTDAMPGPFDVTTSDDGTVAIEFPKSTHVRLESSTHEIGLTRPIPDSVGTATLFATPRSVISVRVRRAASGGELPAVLTGRPLEVRRGKIVARADESDTLTLTRAISLSADEAIYTAPARRDVGTVVVTLTGGGDPPELGAFAIDLSGGASETIDLRAAEDLTPNVPRRQGR